MDSYFNTTNTPFSFINVNTGIPYKEYCAPAYIDDTIWAKTERTNYVNIVNKWLSYKYVDNHILTQNDRHTYGDENYDDADSFTAFNHEEYNEDYNDEDYDVEKNKCKTDNIEIVCKNIFDELCECITRNGFEIYNYNQFKEDFIHYMYTLSDNRELK